MNKLLKVCGGLEGITKNVNDRDGFFLTAPFIGEIVAQMEAAANVKSNKRTRHYQLSPAFIDKFDRDIKSLINMYKHYGVDFQIRSDDKRVHNIVTKKEVTSEAETHNFSRGTRPNRTKGVRNEQTWRESKRISLVPNKKIDLKDVQYTIEKI